MDDYQLFRYSITLSTADEAVLHCLRALCQWAEEHSKPQIGWGGTSASSWKHSNGTFTLRFTKPEYRHRFIEKASELLGDRWKLVSTNENDPANRQRPAH